MAELDRTKLGRSYRFAIEIDGITEAFFTDAKGIEASYDVIEFRSGDMQGGNVKVPGRRHNTNITLKHGVIMGNKALYDWFKGSPDNTGELTVKDVTIKAIDTKDAEMATWTFYKAWPCKYVASDFNANESQVVCETLELAYDSLIRSK